MNDTFLLLLMIFLHIVDDFYLQGWLATAKQRKWWEEKYPKNLYRYDYLAALIMHSFSWTFMIMLPLAASDRFHVSASFVVVFFVNLLIHAITDHAKANLFKINLITDQIIHILQIIATFMWFLMQ